MPHPLDGFQALASLDFITVGRHVDLPLVDSRKARARLPNFDGTVCLPGRGVHGINQSRMTIHDPTKRDLQTLIEHFHDATVDAVEVSVDFAKPGGTDDENTNLYLLLRHSLAPQKHVQMSKIRRRQWNPSSRKYERLTGSKILPNTGTFLWEDATAFMQTRLYNKQKTAHGQMCAPCKVVRMEATLKSGGGPQNGLIHRVGLIPAFVPELRRYFSPMLFVGRGFQAGNTNIRPDRIKDKLRREAAQRRLDLRVARLERSWQRFGAAAGLANRLKVQSDRDANEKIGTALKRLSERLGSLVPPAKVADYESWKTMHTGMYRVFPDGRPASYRGELLPSP